FFHLSISFTSWPVVRLLGLRFGDVCCANISEPDFRSAHRFSCTGGSRDAIITTSKGGNMRRFHLAVLSLILLFPGGLRAEQATFSKDVAPILQRSCQTCHRPNTFAPMPLMTFQDARPWAKSIKEKVVMRNMPPWHIDRNVGISEFVNSIALSDEEIA